MRYVSLNLCRSTGWRAAGGDGQQNFREAQARFLRAIWPFFAKFNSLSNAANQNLVAPSVTELRPFCRKIDKTQNDLENFRLKTLTSDNFLTRAGILFWFIFLESEDENTSYRVYLGALKIYFLFFRYI